MSHRKSLAHNVSQEEPGRLSHTGRVEASSNILALQRRGPKLSYKLQEAPRKLYNPFGRSSNNLKKLLSALSGRNPNIGFETEAENFRSETVCMQTLQCFTSLSAMSGIKDARRIM